MGVQTPLGTPWAGAPLGNPLRPPPWDLQDPTQNPVKLVPWSKIDGVEPNIYKVGSKKRFCASKMTFEHARCVFWKNIFWPPPNPFWAPEPLTPSEPLGSLSIYMEKWPNWSKLLEGQKWHFGCLQIESSFRRRRLKMCTWIKIIGKDCFAQFQSD